MPASSRLPDLLGAGSPLRARVPLTAATVDDGGWQDIWANGMYGGYLSAAADPAGARVRVDLYWPGVRTATVTRVHPDGTTYDVRGGDPATMCTAWARYDYEPPLDVAVTYQATSTERPGLTVTTGPVTVASATEAWLKHPTKPYLNRQITLGSLDRRQRQSRAGVLRPPLRKFPITTHGVMSAEVGSLSVETAGTAELDAINTLLDDDADLLLALPAVWGGHHWYVTVRTATAERLEPKLGELLLEDMPLAFEVVDRPPGEAAGGAGNSYDDLGQAYQTYNQAAAAHESYLELSMTSF